MVAAPQGKSPQDTALPVHEMPVTLGAIVRRVAWFGVAAVGIVIVGFVAMQLLPYGRTHNDPPVVQEPAWDTAQTRTLFARACGDCHSNQTEWSRLSSAAPLSWLTQWAVDEGRSVFNVSEWPSGGRKAGDVAGSVEDGQMPPEIYTSVYPEARLTPAEQQALIRGLRATFGAVAQN
jgi:mono/diheme cytochrome c family protein